MKPDEIIPAAELAAVEETATSIVDFVFQFEIQSDEDFKIAGEELKRTTAAIKEIEAFFEPMRKSTYDAYKAVNARKKQVLDPVELARDQLRALVREYHQKVEQERVKLERAALEKARKEAEAAREKEILESIDSGDEEKAEHLMNTTPVVAPPQVAITKEAPKIEGVSYRDVWSGAVIGSTEKEQEESLKLLCAAIGAGTAPVSLVTINQAMLNVLAKSMKDMMPFPGVTAVKNQVVVTKT